MCGRFVRTTPIHELAELFIFPETADQPPRYNIAPTQPVAVVRATTGSRHRELAFLHWGLIPSWSQDPKIGDRMINARSETAAGKPSFRSAFRKRRCLIPTDGFYEWQKTGGKKRPYFIHRADAKPFAFAGLWEHWEGDGEVIESCTILTTEANELMRPIHDRMPVILLAEDYDRWLDPKLDKPEAVQPLLRPYPSEALAAYPVTPLVNNPRNDRPECLKPAG
jgi:putative SOS response-associated peptidase YedK